MNMKYETVLTFPLKAVCTRSGTLYARPVNLHQHRYGWALADSICSDSTAVKINQHTYRIAAVYRPSSLSPLLPKREWWVFVL